MNIKCLIYYFIWLYSITICTSIVVIYTDKINHHIKFIHKQSINFGTCIAEMAHAREVYELFYDKDVIFMNICMNSSYESWEKMVHKGGIEGENYFFDNDLSAIAAAALLSGGFPTYILIGKDGLIRTKKAPRPSSITQLCVAIDKLIAE